MVRALVYRPRIILPHHVRAFAGFTVQPLALRHPLLFKPPVRMMPFPVGPGKQIPVWQGQAPAYEDDSPSAAEAVNSLVLAMQLATQGPYGEKYWDTEAVKDGIESAIEAADAAGAVVLPPLWWTKAISTTRQQSTLYQAVWFARIGLLRISLLDGT